MKTTISLIMCLAAMPAFAGPSAKEVIPPPPPPAPDLWTWFAGGSVGYMFDYEEPIYAIHAGVDSPWSPGGWNIAFFLELAYAEPDDSTEIADIFQTVPGATADVDTELEIMPLTANIKFEKSFGNGWGAYIGAGAGVAFVHQEIDVDYAFAPDTNDHESDTVFAAQAFAGVVYNFSPSAEIYTGVKWLYLDDTDDIELEDDFIAELGFRWNF